MVVQQLGNKHTILRSKHESEGKKVQGIGNMMLTLKTSFFRRRLRSLVTIPRAASTPPLWRYNPKGGFSVGLSNNSSGDSIAAPKGPAPPVTLARFLDDEASVLYAALNLGGDSGSPLARVEGINPSTSSSSLFG